MCHKKGEGYSWCGKGLQNFYSYNICLDHYDNDDTRSVSKVENFIFQSVNSFLIKYELYFAYIEGSLNWCKIIQLNESIKSNKNI